MYVSLNCKLMFPGVMLVTGTISNYVLIFKVLLRH